MPIVGGLCYVGLVPTIIIDLVVFIFTTDDLSRFLSGINILTIIGCYYILF